MSLHERERAAALAADETASRLRLIAESSASFASARPTTSEVFDVLARLLCEHIGDECAISRATADGSADAEATLEAVDRPAGRSRLVVPLKAHHRVLGTMTMTRRTAAPYTERDRQLAEDLASRAALALERVRLIEGLEERTRALEAATVELRKSEARKAAAMEAALDAIVVMDHAGSITDFNPAAERTFGYSRAEAIGRPLGDLLVPERSRAAHQKTLESLVQQDAAAILGRRIEDEALRKDGTTFPAEIAVVRVGTEWPPLFMGYVRDLTERKRADEAVLLRREKEAAEAANAELEAFSYSVAHDLRAPLRSIHGFTTAVLEDYGSSMDPTATALLGRVIAASDRMSTIIDALLSLARLNRIEPRGTTVDVSAVATRVCEQLAAAEPSRDVRWTVQPEMTAQAEPRLVQTIFENLLGNAWKFTRPRETAHVAVTSERIGNELAYVVRDDGAGFGMHGAHKLFKPFQRLHSAADFEGTGVGLATVARIVGRHGGRIWAESEENAGATFRFTLSRS